jgi:subtilisin family serine protease
LDANGRKSFHENFAQYKKLLLLTRYLRGILKAALLRNLPQVRFVEESKTMYATTTHTYEYMNLPGGAWNKSGGTMHAGEDVVIGIVDTGIYPDHPSFANESSNPYFPLPSFLGTCDTDPAVPNGFCNGKIIAARHFFQGVISTGGNASDPDLNSALDGAGHGT